MNNWKESIEWDQLLCEIRQQQGVLVLGPDLIQYEGNQTLFQILGSELRKGTSIQKHAEIESHSSQVRA